MSYLDWRVGMKVVCVNDSWPHRNAPLRRGEIYTITGFSAGDYFDAGEVVGHGVLVSLREVQNPTKGDGFRVTRFRPVQTRKSDISIFTRMLDPKRQRVDA